MLVSSVEPAPTLLHLLMDPTVVSVLLADTVLSAPLHHYHVIRVTMYHHRALNHNTIVYRASRGNTAPALKAQQPQV